MTSHAIPPRTTIRRPDAAGHGRARFGAAGCQPWHVVRRRHDGLLRYARARGTVSLAVRYATWGHRLLLRLPAYNDASHFLDRSDVALDVDASTVGRVQIARVAGMGLAVPTDSVPEEVDAALEPWPADLPTSAVMIVPESVDWLPVVDDVRFPPLPEVFGRLPATFAG